MYNNIFHFRKTGACIRQEFFEHKNEKLKTLTNDGD